MQISVSFMSFSLSSNRLISGNIFSIRGSGVGGKILIPSFFVQLVIVTINAMSDISNIVFFMRNVFVSGNSCSSKLKIEVVN